MDGAFRFWLSYKSSAEIDNVSRESHLMEARSQVTGEVVARETLEVTAWTDYTWTVERPARINCRNGFREPLKVFMDGVYQFDLAEREDRWILDWRWVSTFWRPSSRRREGSSLHHRQGDRKR